MRAPSAESVPTPTGDSLRAVCAILDSLTRYAHGARIYGPDHPQVVEAGERAAAAYREASACAWPIEMTVGRDAFTLGGELIHAGSDVACLANAMYESGIAAIRLRRIPNQAELADLAGWIASLPQPRAGTLPTCARDAAGVIEIIPVSAAPLRFTHAHESGESAPGVDWAGLCGSLLTGAPGPAAAEAVHTLHDRLAQADPPQRTLAARVLESVIEADADPGRAPTPARDSETAAALEQLTPELRRSMLAVCAASGSDWLGSHAGHVPVDELVGAFRSIDRPGHAPPTATILLLQRLVGSTALSTEARDALTTLVRQWDAADAEVVELMRTDAAADDRTPQDYVDQVRRAATMFQAPGGDRDGAFRFEPVALRVCELALELLSTNSADEFTADHLHLLLERVQMLAEEGRVDLMVAASEAATRLTASSIEAVARHAEHLASAAHAQANVGNVVRRLGTCDESIASLAQLLVIAPEPVISTLASQLADLEIGMDHAHIRAVAAAVCPEALRAVIAQAIQGPAPWVNGVIDFLSACPDEVIMVAGEPLFRSRNHELRARTLRVLDGRLDLWPGRLIEIALTHPDRAIVEIGRNRLMREPGHCRPEILAALLTGSLTGDLPDTKTAGAAIDALISQGNQGVDRAVIVLKRLAHGCNRRRASICSQLAAALEPFRSRPDVAGALRAWRVSPFGVVFELFTSHSHRRAA